jgi:hypothetical protein
MAKKRVRRRIPKKTYNVAPELRCGWPLENGEPCIAGRLKEPDGGHGPRCRHHQHCVPDDMPLERLPDLRFFQADVMKRVRKGLIEPSAAQAIAALGRNLQNIMIAMEKMDPEKAAKRMVTYEEMLERSRNMTVEEARGIAEQRNKLILDDMLTKKITVEVISELDKQKDELTRGEKAQYTRQKKALDKFIDVIENGTPEDVLKMNQPAPKRKPKTKQIDEGDE